MSTATTATAYFSAASLVATIFGLLRRDRARFCWSFLASVVAVTGGILVPVWWPGSFSNAGFYSAKQTGLVAIKALVALEIAQRTFASFPRARVRVGLLMLGMLSALTVASFTLPEDMQGASALLGILVPRHQAGLLATFAIIACASQWYRVPLHPLHRIVLIGFGVCLTANAITLSLAGWYDWSLGIYRALEIVDMTTFAAIAAWWAWAAWRPVASPGPVLARLQPWAHSW